MTPAASADRILFFLSLNDRGGAEISMIALAEGLRRAGRDVTVAVYGARPELGRELGFTGPILDLKCQCSVRVLAPLYRCLRAAPYSVLISALTHTNIIGVIGARLAARRMRVILTEHSIDGVFAYQAHPFLAFLIRQASLRAAAVVAVSRDLAARWRDILSPRVRIISLYNPVVADAPRPLPAPAHEWLTDREIPVILGIGRLKPEKNFALLIHAFALAAKRKEMRLVILGEGEQRSMLQALASALGLDDKILMPGFSADPQSWLGYAALLVCPSLREGFGNVIAEALSCGIAVVATDCPCGPGEILEQGKYGRLVPIDNASAMAEAILASLAAPPDRDFLRARARQFTVSRCIESYTSLIDGLARRNGS